MARPRTFFANRDSVNTDMSVLSDGGKYVYRGWVLDVERNVYDDNRCVWCYVGNPCVFCFVFGFLFSFLVSVEEVKKWILVDPKE